MDKAKCEEIVIDQYLKGNISNDFKDYLLVGFGIPEDEKPFPMNYDVLLKALEKDPKSFLEEGELLFMLIRDSISSGICTEEEIISAFKDRIEELENEPSK